MKTTKLFFMAALVLMTAACSNDDNDLLVPAQPVQSSEGIPFSATISVSNGSAVTRALSDTGEKIEATWAVGEKVALIHNGVKDEMTVSSVSDGGVATITGTITRSPSDGDEVQIIYPSSAAAGTGGVRGGLLADQDGTLTGSDGTSIAERYDVRTGWCALKVSGTSATLNANVSLSSWFCICKFTLQDASGSPINATKFKITSGYKVYTVTPAVPTSELYVAMENSLNDLAVYSFFAEDGSNDYIKNVGSATLESGKFYKSTLKLTPSSYRDGTFLNYKGKDAIIATLPFLGVGMKKYAIATSNETDLTGIASPETNTKTIDGVTYYTFADACAKFADGKTDGSYSDADVWRLPTGTELDGFVTYSNSWQDSPAGWTWTIGSASLFLPAAGFCSDGTAYRVGAYGHYWSSSPSGEDGAVMIDFRNEYSIDPYQGVFRTTRLEEGYTVRLFCQLPSE